MGVSEKKGGARPHGARQKKNPILSRLGFLKWWE